MIHPLFILPFALLSLALFWAWNHERHGLAVRLAAAEYQKQHDDEWIHELYRRQSADGLAINKLKGELKSLKLYAAERRAAKRRAEGTARTPVFFRAPDTDCVYCGFPKDECFCARQPFPGEAPPKPNGRCRKCGNRHSHCLCLSPA
jgi:hypothetical protein